MRSFSKMAMAFGLAACLSASAQAQGPGGGRGMGGMGGGAMLLGNKSLQKELKLSEEQVEKVDKATTAMREKMMDKMQELRDLEGEERQAKMQAVQKEMATEMKKSADAFLSPEQAKRFEQVRLQAAGLEAFNEADVQKALKITAEQKTKMADLRQESMSQRRELMQEMQNDREGTMKKMTTLTKETNEKGMALLTSEQKTSWKEMTGEPFEIKMEGGMQGRPRRQQ